MAKRGTWLKVLIDDRDVYLKTKAKAARLDMTLRQFINALLKGKVKV